ncbi:hypothetical protein BMT55_10075 [Listeria newyorkensis]|uniref:DUF6884 domain-containing protein n=1 Tax=Listeria newyorkensis TaxID=1497681 RepID=A0ABX4XLB4_9LIST|nr:DUF6884 domain-containing protein [Listeria newyorkensis]KGL41097.1 hypothetical protein EP58_12230 [Listeria newyorkensis]PNP91138.1 hypothetical protein BMT55_10075 [Listeria newyorkensis]WAO21520.1 hypothetical protein OTR81_14900 [Listeria newyorkensis]SQC58892.1 Uncharacterised protein [Listeria newyorkensis]
MIIIPSGKPKIWDKQEDAGPVTASQAYTGNFHRLCRTYAEKFDGDYLVLSPKYGFLTPDSVVLGTYDVRFTARGVTKDTISLEELKQQWQALGIEQETMVMLGGKKFEPLLAAITDGKQQFSFPLHGTRGIGDMQKRLRTAINTGEPLTFSQSSK